MFLWEYRLLFIVPSVMLSTPHRHCRVYRVYIIIIINFIYGDYIELYNMEPKLQQCKEIQNKVIKADRCSCRDCWPPHTPASPAGRVKWTNETSHILWKCSMFLSTEIKTHVLLWYLSASYWLTEQPYMMAVFNEPPVSSRSSEMFFQEEKI